MKKDKNSVLGASAHIENSQESGGVATAGKSAIVPPPAEYRFKPGQSGNPKGRPSTSDLKAEVRAFADEADPKVRKTRLRVWLEMADRRARQGSPKHLELLLAYGWGRPAQAIDLQGNINYTDILAGMRAKREQPALPAPTNGHASAQTAQAAASMTGQDLTAAREDDTEQPAQPAVEEGPIKRVVTRPD